MKLNKEGRDLVLPYVLRGEKSTSLIAKETGLSRGTVAGLRHRLERKHEAMGLKTVNIIDDLKKPRYSRVGLLQRKNDQCCWPVGTKTGKHIVFCGRKAKANTGTKPVWCDRHQAKGYRRKKHGTKS